MVSGHLQVKKGFYYVVLSYYNNNGKRRVKYFSTGLPEKGNKRKAEAELARIRSEFVPPQEVGELASNMPFADYLLEWLEIDKVILNRQKWRIESESIYRATPFPCGL